MLPPSLLVATEEEGDSDVSNTSATPQSGAVVGHKFFGPDFSLDAFKGIKQPSPSLDVK